MNSPTLTSFSALPFLLSLASGCTSEQKFDEAGYQGPFDNNDSNTAQLNPCLGMDQIYNLGTDFCASESCEVEMQLHLDNLYNIFETDFLNGTDALDVLDCDLEITTGARFMQNVPSYRASANDNYLPAHALIALDVYNTDFARFYGDESAIIFALGDKREAMTEYGIDFLYPDNSIISYNTDWDAPPSAYYPYLKLESHIYKAVVFDSSTNNPINLDDGERLYVSTIEIQGLDPKNHIAITSYAMPTFTSLIYVTDDRLIENSGDFFIQQGPNSNDQDLQRAYEQITRAAKQAMVYGAQVSGAENHQGEYGPAISYDQSIFFDLFYNEG